MDNFRNYDAFPKRGLYDPRNEHDNCGIGAVVNIKGVQEVKTVDNALKIVETLEHDEFALRAKRIEIPASITGLPFYQKMGYSFKDGKETIDEEHLYRLEKYR